jgi:hypothetical protein
MTLWPCILLTSLSVGYGAVGPRVLVTPPYTFNVWQWEGTHLYTNKIPAGYPLIGQTNFSFLVSGLPTNKNYFAVNAVETKSGQQSDYSNVDSTNGPNVTLTWTWQPPPVPPITNIVTVSAGTNSLTVTNPPNQFWRLRGLSWTNAELLATGNIQAPWLRLQVWNYPSNTTPKLSIAISH